MTEGPSGFDPSAELMRLMAKLEGALLEYVERFGPTERARQALKSVSLWHSKGEIGSSEKPKPDPGRKDA